jgi:hypothetical protein
MVIRKGGKLTQNNRAFDTGSEKIWNSLNQGVSTIIRLEVACANLDGSANGRTSSNDTWRPPRMTSKDTAVQRLGHEIGSSVRFLGTDNRLGGVFYSMRNTKARC